MRRPVPALEKQWTVLDLIRWGSDYFREKDIDSPRLTVELMLCSVLECSRVQLYTDFERPLGKDELAALKAMIQRRVRHEPLQYIVGKADFYGLLFTVTPDVLIPRPETEFLVQRAIRILADTDGARCLDIGTGSGCIPVAIAVHAKTSHWLAVDVSPGAVEIAKENAREHGMEGRVDVEVMDALNAWPEGRFHLVTMNPPYIPVSEVPTLQEEVRDYEPHTALTDDADGLTFFRRCIDMMKRTLEPGGHMLVEVMAGQADIVADMARDAGMTVEIIDDLAGIPRIVSGAMV